VTPACEVCHAREAYWYVLPLDGGRGVECCSVCKARRPADVADMWRSRNNGGIKLPAQFTNLDGETVQLVGQED
jgi:hypothetical protein